MPHRNPTGVNPLVRWRATPAGRLHQTLAWRRALEFRLAMPKCGARSKRSGEPCRQIGLAPSGRCRLHGGLTPRGEAWHKPVVGRPTCEPAKLEKKIRELSRRKKRIAAKVAAMTPEEKRAYDEWHAAHRPGPPGPRVDRRRALAVRKDWQARQEAEEAGQKARDEARAARLAEARQKGRERAMQRLRQAETINTTPGAGPASVALPNVFD